MDNIDLFDKYIKGELSEKERYEFDTRLKDDKSFATDFKVYYATVMGICKDAEQDNKDFEVAMKNISKKQLCEIIGKKSKLADLVFIPQTNEFDLINDAAYISASDAKTAENASILVDEEENTQKGVNRFPRHHSVEEVNKTLNPTLGSQTGKKKIFMQWMWQAACWAVIIGGAAIWIVRTDKNGRYAVDNAIYVATYVYEGASRGTINIPDLNSLSDKELKDKLPTFMAQFNECDDSEDIYEVGYPLAMAYMRLHERDKAKEIINQMINKLSADEDYTEEVAKLKSILNILK